MGLTESYLELHKAFDLKPGDKVMIMREVKDLELGWDNTWSSIMNKSIGSILEVIEDKGSKGFRLQNGYCYPFFILKKIPKVSEPTELDIYIDANFGDRKDVEKIRIDLKQITEGTKEKL